MALIHEIQADILKQNADIAPILLKLRLLAAKIGSPPLAEWVKHEAEGYPPEVALPEYRVLDISYKGTFSGPFGSGIQNAPIPSYLIGKYAGDNWASYSFRQSVAAIDKLVAADKGGAGVLTLNAADLILVLQGKIYPNYACNSVEGTLSVAQLTEIQHIVKNRILELTIELEQQIPAISQIGIGNEPMPDQEKDTGKINQIFHQTIFGGMTNVSNTGSIDTLNIHVQTGQENSMREYLVSNGIPAQDADEFVQIVKSENPESKSEPFGNKAKAWLAKNLGKAVDGSWKVGIGVATEVFKKAALGYYGLGPA